MGYPVPQDQLFKSPWKNSRSELAEGCWDSQDTSGTDVGGNQDLLLALTEALDDAGPLHHGQICCQDGHLVPVLAHLPCQPVCHPPGLHTQGEAEANASLSRVPCSF